MLDLEKLANQTMEDLWDLHQAMYRFLEKNVERARIHFEAFPYDPWMFSHYVRFLTCIDLDAGKSSSFKIERARYAMSGIEVIYKGIRVKVWKATDGELPIPGQSANRKEFMSQALFDFAEASTEPEIASGMVILPAAKIAIIWDADSSLHLSQMDLVCPKDIDNPWKSGSHYFKRTIPHPAGKIVPITRFTEEPVEIELEIERKKVDSDEPGS